MIWTILVLVLGIALYMFSGSFVKQSGKTQDPKLKLVKNAVKLLSVILVAGGVCRLTVPYYLVSVNPMILQDMATNMREQQNEENSKMVRKYVRSNMKDMMQDAPVLGNLDGKKTIFLFSDYSCPYCRRVHAELKRVMNEDKEVRVVLKNFSVHGPLSDAPAKIIIAAKLQDKEKAEKLDNMLMTREFYSQADLKDQSKIGEKVQKNVLKFAKEVGLDVKKLEEDMNGEAVIRELSNVRELVSRFQISGTPYLIIGDKAFPGAIPYGQIVDALK